MVMPQNATPEPAPRPRRGLPLPWLGAASRHRPTISRLLLRRVAVAAAVVAALLLYLSAFRFTWIDDAYIQLQYARTLLADGTWGFYAGFPANTATAPLNVFLIAAAGLPLGSVERAVTVLTALELAALLWLLLRLSRRLFRRDFFGWFAFLALATNPLLISTIGMESFLYALLFVAALCCFLEARWATMALALGLLTLARPDGVLLVVILVPLAAASVRRKAGILLIYTATIAPWFLFSWVYLGSFVPDTLIIKTEQGAWGHPRSPTASPSICGSILPQPWGPSSRPRCVSIPFGSAERRSSSW